MDDHLAQKAVNFALKCEWDKAIEINIEILKFQEDDIDALNRLARAYAEIGNIKKAQINCQKVLKIDPFNQIAQKAFVKYKRTKTNTRTVADKFANPSTFLEEPGKTKIIQLLNTGDKKFITSLDAGDQVELITHSHRVCIATFENKYIGRLPDDLAARLKTLVKGGNKYQVFIKSIENKNIKVFIKEIEKGKDYINTQSFPSEKIDYISYAPPELVNKQRPDTGADEESEF